MNRSSLRRAAWPAAVAAALIAGFAVGARAARDQRGELMQADRDFDEATSRRGAEGWASYFADDGVMMPAGSDMVVGREAIRKFVHQMFSTPGYALRWEPVDAYVSGALGYTYGVYKNSRTGPDGKPVTTYGKYVTIWKKQRDRSWKVAMDIGNSSPPPGK